MLSIDWIIEWIEGPPLHRVGCDKDYDMVDKSDKDYTGLAASIHMQSSETLVTARGIPPARRRAAAVGESSVAAIPFLGSRDRDPDPDHNHDRDPDRGL